MVKKQRERIIHARACDKQFSPRICRKMDKHTFKCHKVKAVTNNSDVVKVIDDENKQFKVQLWLEWYNFSNGDF